MRPDAYSDHNKKMQREVPMDLETATKGGHDDMSFLLPGRSFVGPS
jgi:hypothetical protein